MRGCVIVRRAGLKFALMLTTLLMLTVRPAGSQQAKNEEKPFATLSDRALGKWGHDAHLPPNISKELGVIPQREGGVDVKQIVFHLSPGEIIAFNVSTQNHGNIVIFRITDTDWSYYLTSPEGVLRKAVHFQKAPTESTEFYPLKIPASLARDGFQKEKQCWSEVAKTWRLGPSCNIAKK